MNVDNVKAQWQFTRWIDLTFITAMLAVAVCAVTSTGRAGVAAGPGWLYVLDTDNGGPGGQVILVDSFTGKVGRSYKVGYHPDMALSPDGSRLYITSLKSAAGTGSLQSVLEVYDSASGLLVSSVPNPDSMQSTMPAYGSSMAMSPSGRYIYMLKLHNTTEITDEYITAFDTLQNRFLRDHVSLNTECNFVLVPTSQDPTLDVACANSDALREITLSDSAEPTKNTLSAINAKKPSERWGAVLLQPGENKVAFISSSGSAVALDRSSNAVDHLGEGAKSGPWIQRGLMPDNQAEVYFSTGRMQRSYPNQHDTIVGADPVTLTPRATLFTTQPFFSMALSRDGNSLYTVNPEQAAITIVDAASFREVRRLAPIGHTPTFVIAAP